MKAIEVNIDGIAFRSKLEARWYLFMKGLTWDIEYEPEIEGVYGYQPDFRVHTETHVNLFIEVKPIGSVTEFYEDKFSADREKISNSRLLSSDSHNILLIVGSTLNLKRNSDFFEMGICIYGEDDLIRTTPCTSQTISFTEHYDPDSLLEGIGLCPTDHDEREDYLRNRNDHKGHYFVPRTENNDPIPEIVSNIIEEEWNKAWSRLRWKPK